MQSAPARPTVIRSISIRRSILYRAGLTLRIKIPVACTGPSSLNINGLGSRAIKRANNADTAANDLLADMVVELVYDGAAWQIVNFQGFTSTTTNNNTFIVDIPYAVDVGTANHIIAPFAPAITSTPAGKLILVKVANTNTNLGFNVDIAVNAMALRPVIRNSLIPLAPGDIIPGMIIVLVYDGTSWQMVSSPATTLRIMTGPQSLYVNTTTGHDTNYDGRSATVSGTTGPFKTIQRAVVEMVKWVNNGFQFNIYVANGTYNESVSLPEINGSGTCWIHGNDATPSAVTVVGQGASAADAAFGLSGSNYTIHGFKVQHAAGNGFGAGDNGGLSYWNIEFGQCGHAHIYLIGARFVQQSGFVATNDARIIISGSAPYHLLSYGGQIITSHAPYEQCDLIISQSVSFSAFIVSQGGSTTNVTYQVITNPANVVSGQKYVGVQNSIIDTAGRGVSYYPGPTAGVLSSGAQYT